MKSEKRPDYMTPFYGDYRGNLIQQAKCKAGFHDWEWTPGDYSEGYRPTFCYLCGMVMPKCLEDIGYRFGLRFGGD